MKYKVTRINNNGTAANNGYPAHDDYEVGIFKVFKSVKYGLDEFEAPDNIITNWPPKLGEGPVVLHNKRDCDMCPFQWIMTEITEIIEESENVSVFKTRNSTYKIEKLEDE